MSNTSPTVKYALAYLNAEDLSAIRHDWAANIQDTDQVYQIQTGIDFILATNAYGNALRRPNLPTYMAIVDENTGQVAGLVEIINSEVGKERICKIMDFIYAPVIESLSDPEYMVCRLTMLVSALVYVLSAVKDKGAGHSKIYARDDAGQTIIANLQKMLQNKEDEIGLKVETNGRQWLKFEPV